MLQFDPHANLHVYSMDGKRVAQGDEARCEFQPGVHTFTLRFRNRNTPSGNAIPHSGEFDLSIDAKSGKTYKIVHVKNDDYSKWSTYIVDSSNNNRISSIITNED